MKKPRPTAASRLSLFACAAVVSGPVVAGAETARALANQSATSERPAFEVVSIRPSDPDARRTFIGTAGGRFMVTNQPMAAVIAFAFDIRHEEILGAPPWVASDRFDILTTHAAVAGGTAPTAQVRLMVQAMLTERVRLRVHREARAIPMYQLVVGPRGHALKANTADVKGPRGIGTTGPGSIIGTAAQTVTLAEVLSGILGRRVVDRTNLSGTYDFTLLYMPDFVPTVGLGDGKSAAARADSDRPSIFAAVQEQLGLRLEATRGNVDVVVIDHAERPTEN